MSETELTPKQQVLLKLLRGYIADHGYPPTVRELCRLAGLKSPDTVQYHLDNLRAKGLIEEAEGKSRALALTGQEKVALIPVLGRVPAGPAVGTYADVEGHVPVTAEGQDVESLFALRVKGDSMEPTLMDRDTVVVRWQETARTGDIVVARLDEEDVTVKRFKVRPSGPLLVPDNVKYAPFPLGEGKISGKVVSLIRRL